MAFLRIGIYRLRHAALKRAIQDLVDKPGHKTELSQQHPLSLKSKEQVPKQKSAQISQVTGECQEWDLNPRSYELAPEASALDRSAILTVRLGYFSADI